MTPKKDGFYWYKQFINLRGGFYHHEWLIAEVVGDKVKLSGSDCFIQKNSPCLKKAKWKKKT